MKETMKFPNTNFFSIFFIAFRVATTFYSNWSPGEGLNQPMFKGYCLRITLRFFLLRPIMFALLEKAVSSHSLFKFSIGEMGKRLNESTPKLYFITLIIKILIPCPFFLSIIECYDSWLLPVTIPTR